MNLADFGKCGGGKVGGGSDTSDGLVSLGLVKGSQLNSVKVSDV